MDKFIRIPAIIGTAIGILGTLIYIIILTAGDYNHSGLAGFFALISVLLVFCLLSTFWLPTLPESKNAVAMSAGIAFHIASSFTLVLLMAGTVPEMMQLIFPYLTTLLVSFLMMIVLAIAGIVLAKVDFSKFTSQEDRKISMKN
ncbi:MAG: hypothetical protein WBV93_01315 [Anaerobacillus sp.]